MKQDGLVVVPRHGVLWWNPTTTMTIPLLWVVVQFGGPTHHQETEETHDTDNEENRDHSNPKEAGPVDPWCDNEAPYRHNYGPFCGVVVSKIPCSMSIRSIDGWGVFGHGFFLWS